MRKSRFLYNKEMNKCIDIVDSSVRVWDLEAEKEVMTFSQLNSVAKLAYCSESGLLFSASQAAIKVRNKINIDLFFH